MPFKIIREDITKIRCDAIVNPTNEKLYPDGGVDMAIHQAAGEDLLAMCQAIGGLNVGKAKITPAYNLPCKYVIHTVGPRWEGGEKHEKEFLQSCYREALKIAKGTKCKSVAFPLISSGVYGYTKDQVLRVALDVIKEFLYDNEDILVYIVVYDKTAYALSAQLSYGVSAYIDDNYVAERADSLEADEDDLIFERRIARVAQCEKSMQPIESLPRSHWRRQSVPAFGSVNSLKKFMYKGFKGTLFDFIDEKGINDVECYKRANVSRQTWSKIVNDPHYNPTKKTAIALAISLQLNLDEAQALLTSAGFILSKSSLFDVIIMFCIVKGIYDVFEIDSILFQYDQETLFSRE
jgi:O-acetyl-ADP-ribose deacetylase (regulator of RNase III)/DNA-binding XRE family transcriptional regulator